MIKYQVTAQFGNRFEVVGADMLTDYAKVLWFVAKYENTGRRVNVYKLYGDSSTLIYSTRN